MLSDLKSAFRQLSKTPGFSAAIILTMALGIGATATTFGWITSMLGNPLPGTENSSRLVAVENFAKEGAGDTAPLGTSFLDFRDYRDHLKLMDITAVTHGALAVGDERSSERTWCEMVSGNFFDVLGVKAEVGRVFSRDEKGDAQNTHPVAVISHAFWLRRYHASPSAIGSTLRINRVLFTIIGVASEGFHGTQTGLEYQIWLPLSMYGEVTHTGTWMLEDRGTRNFVMLARLKPTVTIEQAGHEAAALVGFMAKVNGPQDQGIWVSVVPLWKWHWGPQEMLLKPIEILMAASFVLFLIVCANVANLLLARATGRQREFSTRLALGASPRRLARQLFIESLLLAFAGSALGLMTAGWLRDALQWLLPSVAGPSMVQSPLIGPVLGFAVLATAMAAILAGVAPALEAARANVNEVLKGGGRTAAPSATSQRLRGLLVVAEIALAVVTLTGAGIFLRAFASLHALSPGFSPEGQALAEFNLSTAGYSQQQANSFCQLMTERLKRYPGVEAVSYADTVPLGFYGGNWEPIEVEGYRPDWPSENMKIYRNMVGPGYFDVMKIPMIAGRDFTLRDDPRSQNVMIVSREFVRRFLSHGDPIGRKVRGWGKWFTVVGVVNDIKVHRVNEGAAPFFYITMSQEYRPEYGLTFHVRTAGSMQDAISAVRHEAAAIDPALTMFDAQPMTEYVAGSLFGQKIAASILSVLGVLGLMLAAMGLYSVMSYSVAQRTSEIGIRIALGAQPIDVMALVIRQGMGFAAAGLVVGITSALSLARIASAMFDALQPADPAVYAAAVLFTLLVALASVVIPSRRALRVEPMVALRSQ
ncbi:MAG TPA: ABC transporter permease [Opitutaceae bacterium]